MPAKRQSKNASKPQTAVTHSLFIAAMDDQDEQIKQQVGTGADVNMRDAKTGETPLHLAAGLNKQKAVSALIEMKAQVNAKTANPPAQFFLTRGTPLHLAALHRHIGTINLLVAAKADVNATDEQGDTPLHNVVHYSFDGSGIPAAIILLKAGANPTIKGQHDLTPAMLAYGDGETKTGDFLTVVEKAYKNKTLPGLLDQLAKANNQQTATDAKKTNATAAAAAQTGSSQSAAAADPTQSAAAKKKHKKKKKKNPATAADTQAPQTTASQQNKTADNKKTEPLTLSAQPLPSATQVNALIQNSKLFVDPNKITTATDNTAPNSAAAAVAANNASPTNIM